MATSREMTKLRHFLGAIHRQFAVYGALSARRSLGQGWVPEECRFTAEIAKGSIERRLP